MTQESSGMSEAELAEKERCLSCKDTGGVAREVEIPTGASSTTIRLCLACRTRLTAGEFYKLGEE
jgi:hypothetical protein